MGKFSVFRNSLGVPAIALCVIVGCLNAGWWRTYGSEKDDSGFFVQQTSDGDYIIIGERFVGLDEQWELFNNYDIWLLKIDNKGDTLWTRVYGDSASNRDLGSCVQQTRDGGYIIGGGFSGKSCLIKTDKDGNVEWTRTYLDGGVTCVQQTSDGGYILVLSCMSLIKTDSVGEIIWANSYGWRIGGYANSVQETQDGNYIFVGTDERYNVTLPYYVLMLIEVDSAGNPILWREYEELMYSMDVRETNDEGYIILGNWGCPYQICVLKTDSAGDSLWLHTYNAGNSSSGYRIRETDDGGYIIVGNSNTGEPGTSTDVWLVKINANGDTLWTRSFGGSEYDCGRAIQQTIDGGYIIVGDMGPSWVEQSELLIIKTDSLGYVSGVEEEPPVAPVTHQSDWQVSVSVGRQIVLRAPANARPLDLAVFDASGRMVDEVHLGPSSTITWGDGYSPGVYFIRIEGDASATTQKVILIH
ncbi:MAG: T9SS type A sorting domain-containing protein [candidate division WOR-3 bacterium]|nr:T9SS type A sorting domain-containing protein [candidate division WOR-3 bacterium]